MGLNHTIAARRAAKARRAKVDRVLGVVTDAGQTAIDLRAGFAFGKSVSDTRGRSYGLSRIVESDTQRNAADAVEAVEAVVALVSGIGVGIAETRRNRAEAKAVKAKSEDTTKAQTRAEAKKAKAAAQYAATVSARQDHLEKEISRMQDQLASLRAAQAPKAS